MKKLALLIIPWIIVIGACKRSGNQNKETVPGAAPKKEELKAEPATSPGINRPNVNLYLENSGSIFGYINPQSSQYKQAINDLYFYLTSRCDTITTYTINDEIINEGINNDGFITGLSRASLEQGEPGNSDILEMFTRSLEAVNRHSVSILISDGIYDIKDYTIDNLQTKQSQITYRVFMPNIKDQNLQTIVAKMSSEFNGTYFPCCGYDPVHIQQKRPYYIWIFGNEATIQKTRIISRINELDGFRHIHEYSRNIGAPKYSVIPYNQKGSYQNDFDLSELEAPFCNAVSDAQPAHGGASKGEFHFSVALDLSGFPIDKDYYQNLDNYECTGGYQIEEIVSGQELEGIPNGRLYPFERGEVTHLVTFSKSGNPWREVHLRLKENMPQWIQATHSDQDHHIEGDTSHTIGFRYLMQGIDQAYNRATESDYLFDVTIDINQ